MMVERVAKRGKLGLVWRMSLRFQMLQGVTSIVGRYPYLMVPQIGSKAAKYLIPM
jgi:hypothetical protein